jgi:hypothetical protein
MIDGEIRKYEGPPLKCGWCAYEISGQHCLSTSISAATHEIVTPLGVRQVCADHAKRGRWSERERRVGAVA